MARKRNNRLYKNGQKIELNIIDLAYGGKGISKIKTEDGYFVCFVEHTLPGQKVLASVRKCKKKHAECKLIKVLEKSKEEKEINYQLIPGAPYARLPIGIQERNKKKICFQLFKKIGHIESIDDYFDEFISSPNLWHYRNKMEYSFSAIKYDIEQQKDVDDFALGFKHRGTWWMVENLEKDSGLFDAELENSFPKLRSFFKETNLPPWHPPKKEGFFKFLIARKSYTNNKILLNLVTTSKGINEFNMSKFVELLKNLLGKRLAGLIHTINDSVADRTDYYEGKYSLIYGVDKIIENILGLDFEISMQSFFQTNPICAERLYEKIVEYVLDTDKEQHLILDLFCGTGTIGQILSKQIKNTKVIGVDIILSAINNAKKNAERNGLYGLSFHAIDVGEFLEQNPEYINRISTVIIDPPRAGITPKTLKKIIKLKAERLIYVSCNPATQARDTEKLLESGYKLKKISCVDQFPHTSHIETIALFENKDKIKN